MQKHGSAYIVAITLFTKIQSDDILVLGDNKHSRTRGQIYKWVYINANPNAVSTTENACPGSMKQNQDPSKSVLLYQTFNLSSH